MPTDTAIIVFTFKSVERLIREGGTSSWRLDRNHVRRCAFAVCTRNTTRNEAAEDDLRDSAHVDNAPKTEDHQSAFLIGKISNVVPCPILGDRKRYLIQFSEYARVNIPDAWRGSRNPVKYSSLKELGIDPAALNWEPMPAPSALKSAPTASKKAVEGGGDTTGPLTMADAKKGLALTFGVAPEAIEIIIRG
jgi:hypothetical protein